MSPRIHCFQGLQRSVLFLQNLYYPIFSRKKALEKPLKNGREFHPPSVMKGGFHMKPLPCPESNRENVAVPRAQRLARRQVVKSHALSVRAHYCSAFQYSHNRTPCVQRAFVVCLFQQLIYFFLYCIVIIACGLKFFLSC